MEQFPTLTTKRLILDQVRPADIPNILTHAGNIKIAENTRNIPHPYREEDAIAWIEVANAGFTEKDNYMFAIRLKDTPGLIGAIGLDINKGNNRAELGYWLAEPFWNKGITTEAAKAIISFGFEELQLNKIIAVYLSTNLASGKVMVKNGMIKEAEFKDHDVKRGHSIDDNRYVSLIQYSMTRNEYKSLKMNTSVTNTPSITLENNRVRLEPLTMDNYKHLIPIASQKKLVQYSPSDIETPEALKNYVVTALQQQSEDKGIPFLVYDKRKDAYAGCTRYMHIDWTNKVLHIGATWIGKEFHGSGLNTHMKNLMIDHAFGTMGFEKIEFRIDERNVRSRKAVEKLGGVLEGTLRKNVYLLDGFKRNTCCYGILKDEWQNKPEGKS